MRASLDRLGSIHLQIRLRNSRLKPVCPRLKADVRAARSFPLPRREVEIASTEVCMSFTKGALPVLLDAMKILTRYPTGTHTSSEAWSAGPFSCLALARADRCSTTDVTEHS